MGHSWEYPRPATWCGYGFPLYWRPCVDCLDVYLYLLPLVKLCCLRGITPYPFFFTYNVCIFKLFFGKKCVPVQILSIFTCNFAWRNSQIQHIHVSGSNIQSVKPKISLKWFWVLVGINNVRVVSDTRNGQYFSLHLILNSTCI